MASRLRLHVVLPVAVLGLLGLGVGAFALGRSPDPGASDPLPPPPAPTTTAEQLETRFARRANALCERMTTRMELVAVPDSPEDLDPFFSSVRRILEKASADFDSIPWPQGEKRAVLSLRADFAEMAALLREALTALRTGDAPSLERIEARMRTLSRRWNRGMKQLGAPVCAAQDPLRVSSAREIQKYGSAQAALNHQLDRHRVVVVLFYAPGDDYDTIQTRETRAGALAADAGFLALNVKKNRQIAALAAQYDVLEAPATLVFVRGPRLVYKVAGYLDRVAIAQAVTNAQA
jgi:hypothetical protein